MFLRPSGVRCWLRCRSPNLSKLNLLALNRSYMPRARRSINRVYEDNSSFSKFESEENFGNLGKIEDNGFAKKLTSEKNDKATFNSEAFNKKFEVLVDVDEDQYTMPVKRGQKKKNKDDSEYLQKRKEYMDQYDALDVKTRNSEEFQQFHKDNLQRLLQEHEKKLPKVAKTTTEVSTHDAEMEKSYASKESRPMPWQNVHKGIDDTHYFTEEGVFIDNEIDEDMTPAEIGSLQDLQKNLERGDKYYDEIKVVPTENFGELKVPVQFSHALARRNIFKPTTVQNAAIPQIREGASAIIQSGTGTGKTLAYVIPLLQKFENAQFGSCIVFVPSPELAYQVYTEFKYLENLNNRHMVQILMNDTHLNNVLKTKPAIIITRPKYFHKALMGKKNLPLKNVKTIVIDEADSIFHSRGKSVSKRDAKKRVQHPNKIYPILEYIQSFQVQHTIQMVALSATANTALRHDLVVENLIYNPVAIRERKMGISQNVTHMFERVEDDSHKIRKLKEIIRTKRLERGVVVIHDTLNELEISRLLVSAGIDAVPLYQRLKIPKDQKSLDAMLPFTADLIKDIKFYVVRQSSAFGLDLSTIKTVFVMNLPEKVQGYVHLCGRASREGCNGQMISIVNSKEHTKIHVYARYYNFDLYPWRVVPNNVIDDVLVAKDETEEEDIPEDRFIGRGRRRKLLSA